MKRPLGSRGLKWASAALAMWMAGAAIAAADDYLRYTHPTVRGPVIDGVNLGVPKELGDPRSAAMGLVDVTQVPFNADPTGVRDSTQALQRAIEFARDHQMVCFFPPGMYRISDTLMCTQQLYQRSNGRVFGAPLWPCALMGSRAGAQRPKIVLSANAPAFNDPAKPKYVVHIWARGYGNPTTADRVSDGRGFDQEQSNISMNNVFINLDITIGEGNTGAVALRHQGAEGSAIEDCTIDATHGLAGIDGAIGSGGSSAGVTVIGGRIGLDFRTSQPTPVITGFTLIGQTQHAIRYSGRQTLVAAGLKIVAKNNAGPLIEASGGGAGLFLQGPNQPMQGPISLVDSEIIFEPAAAQGERVAIRTSRSVYLNNVYVRGAAKVVVGDDAELPGNPDGWMRVREYAHGAKFGGRGEIQYRFPIYREGKRMDGTLARVEADVAPPADLQARHLWQRDFPSGESAGAANVKLPPYNARGDALMDDTAAIQKAIDEREIVFLPKGYYRISKTLELRPRTKLVGVGQHLSVLIVAAAEGEFAAGRAPAPLVRTADDPAAETVLAFCGLWAPHDTNAYALHWRSGTRSMFRGVELKHNPVRLAGVRYGGRPVPEPRRQPSVVITGHGGGKWYNLRDSGEYAQAPEYRRLLIDGAAGPLSFYQLSPQHVSSAAAVELRGARNVSVYGTKYESSSLMLLAADSANLRFFGHGGNGKPVAGQPLFRFDRCRDFLVANAVEGPTKIGEKGLSHRLGSTDPKLWPMLVDRREDGAETTTAPLERPVLYQRGEPGESR